MDRYQTRDNLNNFSLNISASLTTQIRFMRRLDLRALIAAEVGVIPIPVATNIWLLYDEAWE
jgi:hypothetical protein